MMPGNWRARADRGLNAIGYWLIAGLAVLVPLLDRQPVNTLALFLALAAVTKLALAGSRAFRTWDPIDWTLLAMLASALLSTLLGWPSAGGGFHGVAAEVSYLALFIVLRHGHHGEPALKRIAMAAIAGTAIAAAVTLLRHSPGQPFQLSGVSGTIRSSLYVGIVLLLSTGLMAQAHGLRRMAGLATMIFLAAMLLAMTSRGVVVAIVLCLLIGLFAHYRARALKHVLIAAILGTMAFVMMPQTMVSKFEYKANEAIELVMHGKVSENDQVRIEIWRVALAWIARGEHVLFGIGPRNYPRIDEDLLDLSPPLQFEVTRQIAHAHNLFLTRYIEQGLFGLLSLLALLVLIARHLLRDGLSGRTSWSWWGALGGLLLPVTSGLFNSPWNRDNAWLAVLTFALYLASRERDDSVKPRS